MQLTKDRRVWSRSSSERPRASGLVGHPDERAAVPLGDGVADIVQLVARGDVS
jgi:hypothetical protein